MVPGVPGSKCMLSLIIILNVNKMENKNKTTFNLKKLEDGIKKLKENKILPQNFELRGVGQCIAWGTIAWKSRKEIQESVVCWNKNGIGFLANKKDTNESLILDEDEMITIGQSLSFKIATKLYIGTLTNN